MKIMRNPISSKSGLIVIASFIVGAGGLCLLATFQKMMIGVPITPGGYVVPFLFGGISGAIIGSQFYKVTKLNEKLSERVVTLERFLPICSGCKRIRKPDCDPNKMNSWEQMESYISRKTSSQFSHGLCPECSKELYGDLLKEDH